jgi:hypothetical protein
MSVVPKFVAPDSDEDSYGVEAISNGDVQIKLGPTLPFEVSADEAAKLACLLLKKAGWKVTFARGTITARRLSPVGKSI